MVACPPPYSSVQRGQAEWLCAAHLGYGVWLRSRSQIWMRCVSVLPRRYSAAPPPAQAPTHILLRSDGSPSPYVWTRPGSRGSATRRPPTRLAAPCSESRQSPSNATHRGRRCGGPPQVKLPSMSTHPCSVGNGPGAPAPGAGRGAAEVHHNRTARPVSAAAAAAPDAADML